MKQIWKNIEGYENYYEVSSNGNVRSINRIVYTNNGYKIFLKSQIMLQTTDRNGYSRVYLSKNGKTKSKLVHKLVASSFLNVNDFKSMPSENRENVDINKLEVNHKDENKQNNYVDNLEFCTHKYNSNYGHRTAKIIPKTIDKTRTPIIQCDLNGNIIKHWYSQQEASRVLGISQQNISASILGKKKTYKGFIWKYDKSEEVV